MKPDTFREFRSALKSKSFKTILADPPWQFTNRTGKMAPEHRRLSRYSTMTLDEIKALLANTSETNKPALPPYTSETGEALLADSFDRVAIAAKGLQYERLDQLTIDILLGAR